MAGGFSGAGFAGAGVERAAAEDAGHADGGGEAFARAGGVVDDARELVEDTLAVARVFVAVSPFPVLHEECEAGRDLRGAGEGFEVGDEIVEGEIEAGAEGGDVAAELVNGGDEFVRGRSARIALLGIGGVDVECAVH